MSLHIAYRPTRLKKIIGNDDVKESLKGLLKREQVPSTFLFTGPSGCVDCDTEFLSPTGWKKISKWNNELVMQYNLDGTASFVKPKKYIKRKNPILFHIQTKYGINQCLSLDHRVLYFSSKTKISQVKSFEEIIKIHKLNKY